MELFLFFRLFPDCFLFSSPKLDALWAQLGVGLRVLLQHHVSPSRLLDRGPAWQVNTGCSQDAWVPVSSPEAPGPSS